MSSKLQKGMLAILSANIINLVFNLLTNFVLPKYLSVDSYSAIKTFQLYGMYIGVFSLGCADGMYLRYGGKEIERLQKNELINSMFTFRTLLIIENIFFLLVAILAKDKVIFATVLTILSLNMTGYFKNLYQAVGEFRKYGNILNLTTGLTLFVNIFFLLIIRTDNYFVFLLGYALVDVSIWIILEVYAYKIFMNNGYHSKLDFSSFCSDVRNGFLLMVGNFSSTMLTSMDRWFVKAMMTSVAFAQFSFVVSLEGFLNTAITPITVTLYNYFCSHKEANMVRRLRKYVIMLASVLIAAAFPAKFIIQIYLDKYIDSIQVLFILFGAQLFYVPIKCIYVNLYKAKGKQTLYFVKLISVLIIGAIFNALFVHFYTYKEAFAYGTLISAVVWMILSVLDFKEYGFGINEIIFCLIEIVAFLVLGFNVNAICGFAIYIVCTLICSYIFFYEEFTTLLVQTKNLIGKIRH